MEKTKLGISVGLFGALLYLLGLTGTVSLVILVGYVWLSEQNEWLRKTALKSLTIVLGFAALSALVGLVGNSFSVLNDLAGIVNGYIDLNVFNRLLSIARTLLSAAEVLLLLAGALKAVKQEDLTIGAIDNIINKYI